MLARADQGSTGFRAIRRGSSEPVVQGQLGHVRCEVRGMVSFDCFRSAQVRALLARRGGLRWQRARVLAWARSVRLHEALEHARVRPAHPMRASRGMRRHRFPAVATSMNPITMNRL